jgi:23S rRNA pseudouridine2605 synthase
MAKKYLSLHAHFKEIMKEHEKQPRSHKEKKTFGKSGRFKSQKRQKTTGNESEGIRLNKYLANAGIASRRAADQLIEGGAVSINGKVVTQLGTKVMPGDKVQFGGQTLKREKLRYLLLNKPKGFLTTSDDPFNRRTVMNLVEKACPERIYPVGRLDRNTMGLLLFTNDGDLAKKLMHPKYNVKKIYHVFLDKNLTKNDMLRIAEGLNLEDGKVIPDSIAYVAGANDKKQIGIELHSGKNRIVRRIFEHLGYQVIKLDRVFLAGLTKKDLPRGKWRFLTEKEVNMLKRLG